MLLNNILRGEANWIVLILEINAYNSNLSIIVKSRL